jgi:hypothetical protein
MRKIYKEQLLSLGVVVWLVVQPAIILSLVGVGLTYLIHVILELAGIHALEPTLLALLAITATYFLHKLAEHIFENWHLRRYRKKCTETGMRLFLVEVRARANLVGLVALSEAQSKTS